jgi:putative ABC transport system permease protein
MRAFPLILRAVAEPPARALCTAGGIAGSALLVLVLLASHRSLSTAARTYVSQPGVQLWVAPLGTDNVVRSSALLAEGLPDSVAAIPGIRAADPMVRGFVTVERQTVDGAAGVQLTLLGIGSIPGRAGGIPPAALRLGRAPQRRGEVALDRAAAFRLHVGVGDSVLANGRSFRVVGLTSGTNLLATQFAFFDLASARKSLGLPDRVSFLALSVVAGADVAEVARTIEERFDAVAVHTQERFLANNVREVSAGVLPIIAVIAALGMVVAAILVLLLVQGTVEEQRRELAALRAIGVGGSMSAALMLRAALLALIGVGAGGAASLGLARLLDRVLPTVVLSPLPVDLLRTTAAFVAVAILASLLPLARLGRMDPLEAFRQ